MGAVLYSAVPSGQFVDALPQRGGLRGPERFIGERLVQQGGVGVAVEVELVQEDPGEVSAICRSRSPWATGPFGVLSNSF